MHSSAQTQAFFDEATNTVTYLVSDPATRQAAVIDPVLDYDHRSGKASTRSADRVLATAREQDLAIAWILETHAHADHLSAAPYLKQRTGAQVAVTAATGPALESASAMLDPTPCRRSQGLSLLGDHHRKTSATSPSSNVGTWVWGRLRHNAGSNSGRVSPEAVTPSTCLAWPKAISTPDADMKPEMTG